MCGWYVRITEATGENVADKIAKFLYERTKEFTESGKKVGTSKIFEDLGIGNKTFQQIITNLDLRSERILLPKVITDITKFDEKEEVVITASKDKLVIRKSNIGK